MRFTKNNYVQNFDYSKAKSKILNQIIGKNETFPSEPCDKGKYRGPGMTRCKDCDSGKIPNSDNSDCGMSQTIEISSPKNHNCRFFP